MTRCLTTVTSYRPPGDYARLHFLLRVICDGNKLRQRCSTLQTFALANDRDSLRVRLAGSGRGSPFFRPLQLLSEGCTLLFGDTGNVWQFNEYTAVPTSCGSSRSCM